MRGLAAGLSALLLAGSAGSLGAQSLAEVAKKEEERRKSIKQPSKTFTNDDLGSVPPATATPPSEAAKPAADGEAAKDKAKKDAEKDKEPAKDQAYWADRLKALQAQLDRDQTFADALQTRINSLTSDYTARDDPAQRSVLMRDRQRAIAELDRLKKAIEDGKKAIADLQEEARKAGVPPGWLRS